MRLSQCIQKRVPFPLPIQVARARVERASALAGDDVQVNAMSLFCTFDTNLAFAMHLQSSKQSPLCRRFEVYTLRNGPTSWLMLRLQNATLQGRESMFKSR
jgi:hypothetical protein